MSSKLLCEEFPLQPQLLYTWSLVMWKCPRPRQNHKGPPQLGVCAEVTQSIPTLLPSSPCWLCGCGGLHSTLAQKVRNKRVRLRCCDPTHHYHSNETLGILLSFTSQLAPGDAVSSEQFQRIYCCSSQC